MSCLKCKIFFLCISMCNHVIAVPVTGMKVNLLGTLRFAATDGWTRVARCLGD